MFWLLSPSSSFFPNNNSLVYFLRFAVSEEKDTLSDDECTEPVYDGVEFEGLDSCSQSGQNKEIKLVTSEDDLSKSDLKTNRKS